MQMIRQKIVPVVFLISCLAALTHLCLLNGWLPAWQLTAKPEYRLLSVPEATPGLSYLTLPVTFSMTDMQRKVNEQIPEVLFDKPVTYQEREVRVKVTRTGSATVRADEKGVIRGSVPIAFRADANREGFFKPALNTSGRLTAYVDITLDVDENWNPVVDARSRFKWRKRPVIKVFFREIDVADIISDEIQKLLDAQSEKLMQRLDEQFQFRRLAETSWAKLHAAVPVDEANGIWLTIAPKRAFLEPLEGDEYDLRSNLGLLAEVRLQQLDRAPELTVGALPLLEKELPEQRTFRVSLDADLPYRALAPMLLPTVESADQVRVNDVDIYPSGGQVGVALDQTFHHQVWWQRFRARSYSAGVPLLDRAGWRLKFKPEPQQASAVGRWISVIAPDLQTQAPDTVVELDLAAQRLESQERLYVYLNRPLGNGLMMWSDIESMTLNSVHPAESGLVLRSVGEGQMRLLLGY